MVPIAVISSPAGTWRVDIPLTAHTRHASVFSRLEPAGTAKLSLGQQSIRGGSTNSEF
jgi:hypothetical protein